MIFLWEIINSCIRLILGFGLIIWLIYNDIQKRRKQEKEEKQRECLDKMIREVEIRIGENMKLLAKIKKKKNRKKKREEDKVYTNLQRKKASEEGTVRRSVILEETSEEEQLLLEWKMYNKALEMQKTCKRCRKGTCTKEHARVCKPRNLK